MSAAPPRIARVIDGIRFTYAPAQEAVAQELAPLVAALNRDNTGSEAAAANGPPAPLSVADLREHRAEYLGRIAAAIGLDRPTASQAECYDAFLTNFEETDILLSQVVALWRKATEIRAIDVWTKDELMRRLRAGELIPGFSLDPDGTHVNFDWHVDAERMASPAVQDRLAALAKEREKLRRDYYYSFSSKAGVIDISGGFRPRPPSKPAAPKAPAVSKTPPASTAAPRSWPVVIMPDEVALPPRELAARQAKFLQRLRDGVGSETVVDNPYQRAYLIFHETTEIGVVDHYLGSRDRRWLCEGVANYTAWRVAQQVAGDVAAKKVYDLPAQLAQYAGFRDKVNLRKWPAVENQRKEDADTPLTKAHYAFATRAVSLMVGRHGTDFLPRLFREIGRTPRRKTSMRTVARAYKRLTGEDLSAILTAAVAPIAPRPSGTPE